MKLEKEIKQEKFSNTYQKLIVNLLFTSSWLHNMIGQYLKVYGISPQQYNILRILRGQYPDKARMNLLQERMLDKMSNASRLVEKLRQKGLVDRKTCKDDRRAVNVIITDQGLELLTRLDEVESEWQQKLHSIDDQEANQINKLLDKLRN